MQKGVRESKGRREGASEGTQGSRGERRGRLTKYKKHPTLFTTKQGHVISWHLRRCLTWGEGGGGGQAELHLGGGGGSGGWGVRGGWVGRWVPPPTGPEVMEGNFWASAEIHLPQSHEVPYRVAQWGFQA